MGHLIDLGDIVGNVEFVVQINIYCMCGLRHERNQTKASLTNGKTSILYNIYYVTQPH